VTPASNDIIFATPSRSALISAAVSALTSFRFVGSAAGAVITQAPTHTADSVSTTGLSTMIRPRWSVNPVDSRPAAWPILALRSHVERASFDAVRVLAPAHGRAKGGRGSGPGKGRFLLF
jgi:hypothetical protein